MPYFDHNATSPLTAIAREAWLEAQAEAWHNPSSPHRAGARVGVRLQTAREKIAQALGCAADRVIFTSGATEAAHAIMQHLGKSLAPEERLAVSVSEHPAVLAAVGTWLESDRVARLQANPAGEVVLEQVDEALAGGAKVVVLMAANNETGVLQPWEEVGQRCAASKAVLVCDATQWLGKLPAAGLAQAAGWVFGSAHKFGGPKGVGFLLRPAAENGFVIRRGGGQESGQRGGTEDYPGIAAMTAALLEAEQTRVLHEGERLRWRNAFEVEIGRRLAGTRIVASRAERLWNTVTLTLPHGENHRWVARLDKHGFEVSTGSACASGKEAPSHVLAAMGLSGDEVRRTIRVSAGWDTTPRDWLDLADALVAVAPDLKPATNVIVP